MLNLRCIFCKSENNRIINERFECLDCGETLKLPEEKPVGYYNNISCSGNGLSDFYRMGFGCSGVLYEFK